MHQGAYLVPRTNLDKGLQRLQAHLVQLGSHVEAALTETLQALETGNHASLHVVIEADASIDALSAAALHISTGISCSY
jgi:phosphate transport system protein